MISAVESVFEDLGQIRVLLTRARDLAADIEDASLSRHLESAFAVNTACITRANDLLQLEKATDPHDTDLAVNASWGSEGDRF